MELSFGINITLLCWLSLAITQVTSGSTLSIDRDAQRKCKEYKKVCPERRICAIQHLQWPMNMSFPVCVPRTYVEVKMRVCELPPQPGDCGARFIRWFYNKHSNKCSWFYFQGCRGNQNNFKSKSECEKQCIPERQFDNKAHSKKPHVLAATSPMVMTKPIYVEDRTSNQIIRPYFLRAKKVTEEEKELRRKRRLERRRQKRLRKLRRRRRRKGLKGKKKRREGKVKGRRKRNKNKKDRKRKRKNKKNRKRRRKNRKNKDATTVNPSAKETPSPKSKSRIHEITDDISIVSIFDKTTDTLKSNIEKIKAGDGEKTKKDDTRE